VPRVHLPDNTEPDQGGDSADHYFAETPLAASRPSSVRLTLPDLTLDLQTDSGVFSASRIDPGTKLLLMEIRDLPEGAILDLGCGYGPVAATLARRYPESSIWAVDVNSRARALCALNLAASADPNREVHVISPDEVPADLTVAAIVSNPPIRIGKPALHKIIEFWLERLEKPHGVAWLVVHKNLGADSLCGWMRERGYLVSKVRSRQGYRILKVTQPSA